MIPQEIIDVYNLIDIMEADGWCYVEIRKAMYGLKQDSGSKMFYAYFSLVKNTRIKKMKIFTVSTEDEGGL
jgi:hypothetical protein